MSGRNVLTKSSAFRFVLLIGVVNLWADFTYEGARSITGPFLGVLGASAAVVGLVAGEASCSVMRCAPSRATWPTRRASTGS